MITFCIGSARQKRAYFINDGSAVYLDNAEVLFCASEDGKNYFAFGELPFSDFTVAEYLEYAHATKGKGVTRDVIEAMGINPEARIGKLCPAQYRCVQFLEKTLGEMQSKLVINLDGARYSKKNMTALVKLATLADDVYVCVTDRRFMKKLCRDHRLMSFGKIEKNGRPRFYAAKLLAKRLGAKRIAVM